MGTQLIKGEDIILIVDGQPTLHATSHNLKIDLELLDYQTKDTPEPMKYPGNVSWSADGDGLIAIDPEITAHSTDDIIDLVLKKKEIEVVIKSPFKGLTKLYTGKGYVTSFSLASPVGDKATYNYSITGSGALIPSAPAKK